MRCRRLRGVVLKESIDLQDQKRSLDVQYVVKRPMGGDVWERWNRCDEVTWGEQLPDYSTVWLGTFGLGGLRDIWACSIENYRGGGWGEEHEEGGRWPDREMVGG